MPKALRTTSLRIEIRYLPGDILEWEILEPDTRKSPESVRKKLKWRPYSSGASQMPTWDRLQQVDDEVLSKNKVRAAEPIILIHNRMKYDIHCLDIERRKQSKLKDARLAASGRAPDS